MQEQVDERGHELERERHGLLRTGLAEVYNPSMVPTLNPGDRLVVRYGAGVRPGDVVVLRHPFRQDLLIVKRAAERRDGGWWVTGDNPLVENDSREFGTVPDDLVVARAWLRLRPPPGAGQRSVGALLSWALSAVRPLRSSGRSPWRLRAR
ncbi:S26 family signal peptidase [Streptomyces mashuensis]|uniref:S26 family signal peptidase n=1 Tax=Streptomyces mashuensis TaxID=33904 RepID=A0A919EE73_9ACTN|nr:nickel-type superoxide dismutase maturation protease [Streptomyces mashuensis]GHF51406.1 S26 family signal peptidase [Streptomyces mashuensis]